MAFLLRNAEANQLVVIVRSTLSTSEWVQDFQTNQVSALLAKPWFVSNARYLHLTAARCSGEWVRDFQTSQLSCQRLLDLWLCDIGVDCCIAGKPLDAHSSLACTHPQTDHRLRRGQAVRGGRPDRIRLWIRLRRGEAQPLVLSSFI